LFIENNLKYLSFIWNNLRANSYDEFNYIVVCGYLDLCLLELFDINYKILNLVKIINLLTI